jgi:hypothetical protein
MTASWFSRHTVFSLCPFRLFGQCEPKVRRFQRHLQDSSDTLFKKPALSEYFVLGQPLEINNLALKGEVCCSLVVVRLSVSWGCPRSFLVRSLNIGSCLRDEDFLK